MDALDAAVDHRLRGLAFAVRLLCGFGGVLRALRHFMGGSRHLVDRRGHLVGLMALLRHGLFGTLRLLGHLADQLGELASHLDDLPDQAMHLLDETVERARQLPQLVFAGDRQAARQVALAGGDVIEVGLDLLQRAQEGVAQPDADHPEDHQQDGGDHHDTGDDGADAALDLGFHLGDLRLDAIQVECGTQGHVPLRQVVAVGELGHQHRLVARQRRGVIDEVAVVLGDVDQLTVDVDTVRVAPVGQALADVHRAVAAEQTHDVGVVAEEVAVGAVLDLGEHGDGLLAAGHVTLRSAVVEPLHGAEGDLDVVLEFAALLLHQALTRLGNLFLRHALQHLGRGAAQHQGEEDDRNQRKQYHFGFQCQAHCYCP